jgi:hypothetical protein
VNHPRWQLLGLTIRTNCYRVRHTGSLDGGCYLGVISRPSKGSQNSVFEAGIA